ncbi:3-octaprenyl-4-hydroxybenzoate carboxy-lyase [Dissostichus eleginoides]|uniref:3-octaprenyl-4-hydroxybenzoate carboxy-lyase n=1 Tax=Dissostichus eleginoides TaxID=100907 RepID=A0AAD9BMG0_DISEL|nr:3-octaprenyl-4-hydroxybenzoate carboxy-lyase [Dissostichus eleginoides]
MATNCPTIRTPCILVLHWIGHSFKKHLENTKAKVNTRNNILRKLVNSKWGADPPTIRATAMVLCFSTVEYACSSWCRSHHTKLVDTALNDTCRIITGQHLSRASMR